MKHSLVIEKLLFFANRITSTGLWTQFRACVSAQKGIVALGCICPYVKDIPRQAFPPPQKNISAPKMPPRLSPLLIRGHGGGNGGGIPPPSTPCLFSKVQTFWDPYLLSSPPKPSTPRPCMPLLLLLLNEPKNYFHLAGSPRLFLSSSCCVRRSHSRCLRRREREKITTERVDQKKKGTLLLPRATQKFFVCGRGPFKKKGQIFGEPPPVPRRHGEGAEKEKKNEKESHLPPPPCYIPRIPFHLLFFFFHPKFFSDFFVWDTTVHYTT